jgi:aryl-alcohol dehydrogenase-like predicted oxidoreductase
MQKRQIGKSDLFIAPLVFGGNVFGWTTDEPTSFRLLDAFTDAGFNAIDTADIYANWFPGNSGGESETIIGNWLKKRQNRNQVIIATKVGGDMGSGKKSLAKAYILKAVDDSLKRLQTDYIDLYQSHYDDPETPIEETLETYNELIKAGKVRFIGASNFTRDRLRQSLEISARNNWPRYESLQPEYNLYNRQKYETELEPFCQQNQIGVLSYYALASGFLTGKYRSEADFNKSQRGGGMGNYLNQRGIRILNALDEVSAELQATPAQVALAWLMARPGLTAPIASATKTSQLTDFIQAAQLTLTPEAIGKLNQASAY